MQTVIAQINQAIGALGVASQACKNVVEQYGESIIDLLFSVVSWVYIGMLCFLLFDDIEMFLLVFCYVESSHMFLMLWKLNSFHTFSVDKTRFARKFVSIHFQSRHIRLDNMGFVFELKLFISSGGFCLFCLYK